MKECYLTLDVGGSKYIFAILARDGEILARRNGVWKELSQQEKDPTVPAWLKAVGSADEMRTLIGTSAENYEGYGIPVLYLTGSMAGISKDSKVNLEYAYPDRTGTCTLKWQGSSSIAFDKKKNRVRTQ